jgi:hypothetical protein
MEELKTHQSLICLIKVHYIQDVENFWMTFDDFISISWISNRSCNVIYLDGLNLTHQQISKWAPNNLVKKFDQIAMCLSYSVKCKLKTQTPLKANQSTWPPFHNLISLSLSLLFFPNYLTTSPSSTPLGYLA